MEKVLYRLRFPTERESEGFIPFPEGSDDSDSSVSTSALIDAGIGFGMRSCESKFNDDGELDNVETDVDYDYDCSTEEMYHELTEMFLDSPSDCKEVPDLDTSVYIHYRNSGVSSYDAARYAYAVRQDERINKNRVIRRVRKSYYGQGYWHKSGYATTDKRFSEPLTVGESGELFPEGYDDDSAFDTEGNEVLDPDKGSSGNGFYRYSRFLADNREDRFLSFLRWIDSADPKELAVAFGPGGSFYRRVQADRSHNLYSGHCKYGPVYRAGSHESVRYTSEQAAILTIAARGRLGWTVKDYCNHVVSYWRFVASEKRPQPTPRPTPGECREEREVKVTQGRSNLDVPAPLTATESTDMGRWGTSVARAVKGSHLDPEMLTLPGKVRKVNRKRQPTNKDESDNRGHRLWSYCKRK